MRLMPIISLLFLLLGCVEKDSPPTTQTSAAQSLPTQHQEETHPHWRVPRPAVNTSPFLPALARAGLWPPSNLLSINAIEYCGTITVEEQGYFVLYIDCCFQLFECNRRGCSRWLICDTSLRPVWKNRDWGGKPGVCSGNQIKINLTDKFFEIEDEPGFGDLLTFRKNGTRLSASIGWASDESRIAQFLNWPKWRDDSHEPDEEITQILPVAGHPDWRIVLTQYPALTSQGCAHLIAIDASGEFGCRALPGIWSDQACRPVNAGSIALPHTGDTLVWIDYETRSGWRHTHKAILHHGQCISLAEDDAQ